MFFGKDCNYAFAFNDEDDFDVFFIISDEDENKYVCDLINDNWNNVDTCILWAAYKLFVEADWKFSYKKIKIQGTNELGEYKVVMEIDNNDTLIELMWETLTDVNIDEDECIEQNWFVFPVGTYREDIWHWFDEHHSKGVGWLMNDYEG